MTNDLTNNNLTSINKPAPSANVQGIIDRVRSQVLSIDDIITQETNPFRYYTSKIFAILDNIRGVYHSPKHFGDIVDALNQQREKEALLEKEKNTTSTLPQLPSEKPVIYSPETQKDITAKRAA